MCGRFVSTSSPDELADYFGVGPGAIEASLDAAYNVAPTDDIYAVVEHEGTRHLDAFFWGLVPHWADGVKIGSRMINARAESVATSNAYKRSFRTRRCLIPATGFYEWKRLDGKTKQPVYLSRVDGEPIAFAGLWAVWHGDDEGQEPLRSATIITTTPNELAGRIHDRMPVILSERHWARWLDRDDHDTEALRSLLVPADDDLLTATPVRTEVNNVRNEGPQLIEADPEPAWTPSP